MSRKTYLIILALGFSIAYFPTVVSIIIEQYIFKSALLKTLLMVFALSQASINIPQKWGQYLSGFLAISLIVGAMFMLQHWPYGRIITLSAAVALFLFLLYHWWRKPKKDILTPILYLFVLQRCLFFIFPRDLNLWWIDVIIGTMTAIAAIIEFFWLQKSSKNEDTPLDYEAPSKLKVEDDIRQRIEKDFVASATEAKNILYQSFQRYDYLDHPRIARCIIFLAEGSIKQLKSYIEVAVGDPRNVILMAEYTGENSDQMERIRNFNHTFEESHLNVHD